MKTAELDYPAIVRHLDDGHGYQVEYPDLPGCVSRGATPKKALKNARDVLKTYLRECQAGGRPSPPPSAAMSGQWRQRVPRSLHARLTARARYEGVSLNTLVTALVAEGLGRREEKGTAALPATTLASRRARTPAR